MRGRFTELDLPGKAFLFVIIAVVGAVAISGTVLAAGAYNFSVGPNPEIPEDTLTISEHNRSEMTSPIQTYNDNGELVTLEARLNTSANDNPLAVRYDKIEDDEFDEFPRKDEEDDDDDVDNEGSLLDASEWSSDSGISVSQDDGHSVGGVTSIKIATDGNRGAGDVNASTYSNFTISADPEKRVLFAILQIDSADSATDVHIRAEESDGDYKEVEFNQSRNRLGNADVFANSTGDGIVVQAKLSDLTTEGSGDGTLNAIDKVVVETADGDATIHLTAFDLEKKTKRDLGTYNDADDEDVERFNVTAGGTQNLTAIDTLGDWSSDASLHDLELRSVEWRGEDVDSEDVEIEISEALNYGSYPSKAEIWIDLLVPAYIDLSHSGLALDAEQKYVNQRYATVEYAEDIDGETEFGELDSDKYSDLDSTFNSVDEKHSVDDTVSAGTTYRFHYVILLQDDEVKDLQDTSGGGVGGPVQESKGPLQSVWTWITGMVMSLLAAIGLKKRGN